MAKFAVLTTALVLACGSSEGRFGATPVSPDSTGQAGQGAAGAPGAGYPSVGGNPPAGGQPGAAAGAAGIQANPGGQSGQSAGGGAGGQAPPPPAGGQAGASPAGGTGGVDPVCGIQGHVCCSDGVRAACSQGCCYQGVCKYSAPWLQCVDGSHWTACGHAGEACCNAPPAAAECVPGAACDYTLNGCV
jgi:hypothetical protein